MPVSTRIVLDTRRIKQKTGKYPVKLLVVHNRQPQRYQTIFELTKEEYKSLSASRIASRLQQTREDLKKIRRKAEDVALEIVPFSFDEFEKEYLYGNPLFIQRKYIKQSTAAFTDLRKEFDYSKYYKRFRFLAEPIPEVGTIAFTYFQYIKNLLAQKRLGTAISLYNSYRSFFKFRGNVHFTDVTVTWLSEYEIHQREKGLSRTTIGMYVRALRTIFNEAAVHGIIRKDKCYPFGRRKYIIPNTRSQKKALTLQHVEQIFYFEPRHEAEGRARDYWILLYLCNGINPKDLALLKFKNVQDGYLHFERAKTINTGKADPKIITVYITEEIQSIVDRLGNSDRSPENYIFPILQHGIDELREHELIKLFIAFVNKWMVEIAKALALPRKPTTVISRHTFATVMKNAGASTEYIQEALGHHNKETTEFYLDSFEKEIKKQFAVKLIVDSCHDDPLFLSVDPPREGGNKCKSLVMIKNTKGY
jgi:integrase/recombinase XerD